MNQTQLQAIMKNAPASRVAAFVQPLTDAMEAAGINTPLRQAHFLAQIAQESGELRYTEEIASGIAYEGRKDLGNTHSGDGVRFKGRGLLQITGRNNYTAFAAACGQDVVTYPATVATLPLSVESATWYWTKAGLNALADRDDVIAVTRRINGGTNGLAQREAYLAAAKNALRG